MYQRWTQAAVGRSTLNTAGIRLRLTEWIPAVREASPAVSVEHVMGPNEAQTLIRMLQKHVDDIEAGYADLWSAIQAERAAERDPDPPPDLEDDHAKPEDDEWHPECPGDNGRQCCGHYDLCRKAMED